MSEDKELVQKDAMKAIFENTKNAFERFAAFDFVKKYDEKFITSMLGVDISERLLEFCKYFDFSHPDITSVASEKLAQEVNNFLLLANYATGIKAEKLLSQFSKIAQDEFLVGFNAIYDKGPLRLIENRSERDENRGATKEIQNIAAQLDDVSASESFRKYVRNSVLWKEDVEKLSTIAKKYEKLNMIDCKKSIEKMLDVYSQEKNKYFGFYEIDVKEICAILAKQHNCLFSDRYVYWNKTHKNMAESQLVVKFNTYTKMGNTASETAKAIIDHVEAFPEVNGRTLFDDLLVVVPSSNATKEAADIDNIKKQIVSAIVIGRRQGKNYFLCYWN